MQRISAVCRHTQFVTAALLFLCCAVPTYAYDRYVEGVLYANDITIGSATYYDVVVNVESILSGSPGPPTCGGIDSYDPSTNQITISSVAKGPIIYCNVVATLADLVSIGSVSGSDSYGSGMLTIPAVQVGDTIYTNVVLSVGVSNIISVRWAMPAAAQDSYDISTGLLNIPAVSAFGAVYTNVTLHVTLANVVSVGGSHAAP